MTKHGTHASVRAAMVRYDNHGNHTLKINSTIHYMAITKTHLNKCLRKACLGTNNEHTMIAYTCCDNRHKFIIDMEIGQRDIDKHIHKICFEKKSLYGVQIKQIWWIHSLVEIIQLRVLKSSMKIYNGYYIKGKYL